MAEILQAGCASCCTTNNVKALKDKYRVLQKKMHTVYTPQFFGRMLQSRSFQQNVQKKLYICVTSCS